MTCIVAKIHEGKVHMVGDQMGSNGFTHSVFNKASKVFKVGDFLIGYTTSFRMGQILQYSWTPPVRLVTDTNDDLYLYKTVVDSIKKCFDDNSYGQKKNVEFDGGTFIIGWKGRIFEMQDNLSLLEYDKFSSVGCGTYHATAAMKTMDMFNILCNNPEQFLVTAIKVAADSVGGVSHTYNYIFEE